MLVGESSSLGPEPWLLFDGPGAQWAPLPTGKVNAHVFEAAVPFTTAAQTCPIFGSTAALPALVHAWEVCASARKSAEASVYAPQSQAAVLR